VTGEPDIAGLARVLADPARARMLSALMTGKALTATELAASAGVSSSTASAHLAKLTRAGVVAVAPQGRHRYFRLRDRDIAAMIEGLMGVAAREDAPITGPRNPDLRKARVCYDHLAGALAVWILDGLRARALVVGRDSCELSPEGERFFRAWGIDMDAVGASRRPVTRDCLDWSERRYHLGGGLGAAMFDRMLKLGWASRDPDGRVVRFSAAGERACRARFKF